MDDTDDTLISGWNNDAGRALRVRTTFDYAGDWGGAKIRLQSNGFGAPNIPSGTSTNNGKLEDLTPLNGVVFVEYAYGWANLLDSKIVLSAGKIGDDLWGLGKLSGNVFDPSHDAVTGVRAAFNLVDGLSFGLALPTAAQVTSRNSDGHEYNYGTVASYFGGLIFGGLFKSDSFNAAATVKLIPKYDPKASNATGTDSDAYVDVIGGVEIALAPLNIVVDARFDSRNEDTGTTGFIRIGPLVRFTADALTVHARGDIGIQNGKGTPTGDSGRGNVENPEDASIAFRVGADYAVNSTVGAYIQVGSDNVAWLKGDATSPGNGIYVKPGVKFTLGTSNIEIFDKINRLGADDVPAPSPAKAYSPVNNQFQIDFNWSF
ncbi:MAG: hypothetical protein LBK61_04470 [Spirochaetaceae bacterium]|nr:hypothetical protein [Spirochaetaceae bacterium]